VFEGEGRVQEYVGGYEDWLRQRRASAPAPRESAGREKPGDAVRPEAPGPPADAPLARKKLSYKEQKELEQLPARIESLEAEGRALEARIGGAGFYTESRQTIEEVLARHEVVQRELQECYERWDALDARS